MTAQAPSARYEIRLRGVLGDCLLAAFPDLHVETRGAATVLTGGLPDQSALFGVLAQVEALGLELLGVHRLDARAE
jgi:class 3 adenylate cyclase